jgi:CheY-like chemotaxis protein
VAPREDTEPDLLHVLVIDDDEQMRQLITRILLPGGHQVVSAGSAEEGLELLPYYTFQVAILDNRLPGMEGLVLGEFLRRNNAHMKIALVTGDDDARLDRFGEEQSIIVIHKPFEVGQILDLISRYQAEASARSERTRAAEAPGFDPELGAYLDQLAECFEIPNVPKRIEERLVHTIKRCLNDLRAVSRYNERDRVAALAGLLAMEVLGLKAPRASSGRTLFEEYDALMREHRRRTEFGGVERREAGGDGDGEEAEDG